MPNPFQAFLIVAGCCWPLSAQSIPKQELDAIQKIVSNNETQTIKPLIFRDPVTQNYFYVESDGRHVTAFAPDGRILWHRNPFVDANLAPYRKSKPVIVWIGRSLNDKGSLGISFNSSQFGRLNEATGDFHFEGQD